MTKYIILSVFIFNSTNMLFSQNKKELKDFYNMNDITGIKYSNFKEINYKEIIDYKKVIFLIQDSKRIISKFIPKTEIIVSNLSNVSYKIYFSENYRYIEVEGKSFKISKKNCKELLKIFNED